MLNKHLNKYDILDAARTLRRLIRDAPDDALNDALQILASDANDSDHAESVEPTAHIAGALQAEFRRRALTTARRRVSGRRG